jgi:hypothetical protein
MISIRLSEEEYTALMSLCSSTGARSMSELTRDAMRSILHNNNASHDSRLEGRLDEFRTQISRLERKLEELSARMESSGLEGEG